MSGLGHVVCDGERFEITAVRLHGGRLTVSYEIRGPHKAMSGPLTVFGDDGTGVWQGSDVHIPAAPDGATFEIDYDLQITEVTT